MPTLIDFAFLFLVTVVLMVFETTIFFPRFKAAARAKVPGARPAAYRRALAGQWAIAGIALVLWMRAGRPWSDLGLVPPTGVRALVSVALVVVLGALAVYQRRAFAHVTQEGLTAIREAVRSVEFLLPHTRDEARWFVAVSITAGICEELLYRGFLVWALRPYVGTFGAMSIGVVIFAVGHAYQGWRGILKTGAAGAAMSIVVWATGWLIPAMVLHALIDLNSGMLGFAVLDESRTAGPTRYPPP